MIPMWDELCISVSDLQMLSLIMLKEAALSMTIGLLKAYSTSKHVLFVGKVLDLPKEEIQLQQRQPYGNYCFCRVYQENILLSVICFAVIALTCKCAAMRIRQKYVFLCHTVNVHTWLLTYAMCSAML